MNGSADRELAVRLLVRIGKGDYAGPLLERVPGAPVRVRVLGVLRWRLLLDTALARFSRTPLDRLDPEVLAVLRLGLFEAVELGVPPPVAVDAAVHLVRRVGKGSASGLVNAVLRRAVSEAGRLRREGPDAVRWSHPAWLLERWHRILPEGDVARIVELDQRPAGLWVWFPDEDAGRKLAEAGALRGHPWMEGAFSPAGDPAPVLEALAAGAAYAQDPASQLVARLAARLAGPGGGLVVDLCAAPGGKSALLSRELPEATVLSLDLHLSRARLLGGLRSRVGGTWRIVTADGGRPPVAGGGARLVLVDAPCSGTGTLRRHPEIRWRLRPEDIAALAGLQQRLLRAAAGIVGRDGTLLYSTCSLEPEENEEVVGAVLRDTELEPVPLQPLMPEGAVTRPTSAGGLRLLPGPDNDGFSLHALRPRA